MEKVMTEEVCKWIEKEKLIQTGDMVLVGVSGGADSVCLLLVLLECQQEFGFLLQAVHVEHGIRGAESMGDAQFVKELCQRVQIPCQTYHVDVPSYAREHHIGMEEAARKLRYECFYEAAEQSDAAVKKIALAHHADDNAETMLFQMVRGSGVRGLGGMRIKRELGENITLIRPLLNVTRSEIEAYLHARGEVYRVDITNQDTDYSRNRIRHNVVPQLTEINSQALMHIAQSARQLSEVADYLQEEALRIAEKTCVRNERTCLIQWELLEKYPVVLQKEVLYRMLCETAGNHKNIASVHIESVMHLISLQVGRRISLPYELEAERVYEGIRIAPKYEEKAVQHIRYEISLDELKQKKEGEWYLLSFPDGEMRIRIRNFDGETGKICKKAYTKLLDYDKIKHSMQFRKRAGGDYLIIDEMGHRKKLKEYFIEEKMPREQRNEVWLLTEEEHVIWVVGKRIGADYKINPYTKKVLEIQMSGGVYCED